MTSEYRSRPRDEAAEKIECYIIENRFEANQKLPSERDMCAMWGFNRTTLRSAIRRLVAEGVLYNRVGSGTFVAPQKLVRNLQDAEGFGSAARAAGRTPGTRLIRAGFREASKQISQKMKLPLGHRMFELIRVRLLEDEPVLMETAYLDARRLQGIENYDFSKLSLYSVLQEHFNIKIIHGEEKLNVTYTDEEEAAFLGIPEGVPVLYQTGVVSDENNVPVEYFKSIARSEYIRFASVLLR
ncbi:HTH-type transcriptional repressor DasR [Caprobacter fermentans]|uniref:HTH-type transcriptional repressor DasR n=1 Tax=Caproicibacter fermentans TaxID=2576756 RepID=A0A6N8HW08_9FIRM|nr:GntR family transcriptional regulator [Caproicibacter fermentans]MVB10004.1 HTH-type transcriptional repressor DasR [Caproicibacter fermentans]OCN02597.1 GntR family transcriptional regulator [Clostridium sp. W14A]